MRDGPSAFTYQYMGLVAGDNSASFTGTLSRVSGNSAGSYSILQNTLAASGNYTISSYIPGLFTINVDIPSTVVRVSQAPPLGAVNSAGSIIPWHWIAYDERICRHFGA